MATNTQKKAQAHMAARDTRPAAHAKYVRISSRKVKIVIDLICWSFSPSAATAKR